MTVINPPARRVAQGGPPLSLVAGVFTGLFVASLVASSLLGGGAFPSPFGDPAEIQVYFAGERTTVMIGAVLQFGAAVPLAIFATAVCARLQQHPPTLMRWALGLVFVWFGALKIAT